MPKAAAASLLAPARRVVGSVMTPRTVFDGGHRPVDGRAMIRADSHVLVIDTGPTFELEAAEMSLGCRPVAGVDEAGRGPWAGPVVAAAVILDARAIPPGLDDSKALHAGAREAAYARILATARVGVGIGDVARIDRDNILQATFHAMTQAVAALGVVPGLVIVDGNRLPRLACPARAIVRGDARCLSIAAASIVAKVTRDRLMVAMAADWPGYGFERHKGYGTPEHKAALAALGVTPHHRRSFRPVQLALKIDSE